MVKEEILAGLKVAISKGEPLNRAMMTFYNAGYKKQDIEEAARMLQAPQLTQFSTQPVQQQPPSQPIVMTQNQQNMQTPGRIQRISSYEEKPSKLSTVMVFFLIFLLLCLLGALIGIFLFKDELSQLLNNLFG